MAAYARPELLAEPDWLAQNLDNPGVRIIDCATLEAYRRAHIPGAVQLPVHFYIKENDPQGSDHGVLVMPPSEFEALMAKLGVSNDTTVVTYDDNNALVASRLWWVLKYYGHTNAKVLNGGWHRWLTENRPVTFHATRAPQAAFSAKPNPDLYASVEYLKEVHADPGCQLKFVATDDSRKFLPAEDIQRLLDDAGFERDKPTITYCQGGIRAAHAAFVMDLLGYDNIRVYDGSMREWANREDTPLVR